MSNATAGHLSFPLDKEKIRILLLEGIRNSALETLQAAGYTRLENLPAALPGLERQPVFLQPDALLAQMPESQKVSVLVQRFLGFWVSPAGETQPRRRNT